MAKICAGGDPRSRVAINVGGNGEGTVEDVDGFGEVVEMVEDDAKLIEKQRISATEGVSGVEEFVGESHVVEL